MKMEHISTIFKKSANQIYRDIVDEVKSKNPKPLTFIRLSDLIRRLQFRDGNRNATCNCANCGKTLQISGVFKFQNDVTLTTKKEEN